VLFLAQNTRPVTESLLDQAMTETRLRQSIFV